MSGKKSLKYKFGMGLIFFGMICPLFSFIVPFLNLSTAMSSTIIAFLMVGGPELFLIAGGALAGKEALDSIKSRLFKPAGKTRYTIGMTLFISGVLVNWALIYLVLTDVVGLDHKSLLVIVGSIDIASITGLLLMGTEFFSKCKRLFTWEGVEAPK
ncbi:MAG: hypothetical protein BA863_13875 [Desulfovibrio sp. S3730MH75]|nr:MAG: hypothetical protein BA863_13875 [Desulfovibrio sp. S3730MH75]